jgi:hypothetical protein
MGSSGGAWGGPLLNHSRLASSRGVRRGGLLISRREASPDAMGSSVVPFMVPIRAQRTLIHFKQQVDESETYMLVEGETR